MGIDLLLRARELRLLTLDRCRADTREEAPHEPDLRQTRDVMTLLRAHASAGRSLLLSIHQLVDAGRACYRLVLLSARKVVGQGSISELRREVDLPEAGAEEIFLALT